MRGSVAVRFDYLLPVGGARGRGGGGVVFGVRAEARNAGRRRGFGGGREDKANQTVNNRGTAERKGSERGAQRCLGG